MEFFLQSLFTCKREESQSMIYALKRLAVEVQSLTVWVACPCVGERCQTVDILCYESLQESLCPWLKSARARHTSVYCLHTLLRLIYTNQPIGGPSHGQPQPWAAPTMGGPNHGRPQPWEAPTMGGPNHGRPQPWAAPTMGGTNGKLKVKNQEKLKVNRI